MQRVPINELQPGMIAAKNIYNAESNLLLAAGQRLTSSHIFRLESQKVGSVYIHNNLLGDTEIPEILQEEMRISSVGEVKKTFSRCKAGENNEISGLQQVVGTILDEVMTNRNVMIQLTDIRLYDDYTFAHSVNVCVLSMMLGAALGYSKPKLQEVGMGALLHDIGKTLLPPALLNKPGKLTAEEMQTIQTHAMAGFEILRRERSLPVTAAHVALAHHEKLDGSGYPQQLKDEQIPEYSRIVAIADIYDAITSDRPYRQAFLPHEAYNMMMEMSGLHLDPIMLASFFQLVCIYPVGSLVELDSGEFAVVTGVYVGMPFRPRLKVFTNACGEKISHPWELDLTEQMSVAVKRSLRYREFNERFTDIAAEMVNNSEF